MAVAVDRQAEGDDALDADPPQSYAPPGSYKEAMMRRFLVLPALLLALAAACGGGGEGPASQGTLTATARPTGTPSATAFRSPTAAPTVSPTPMPSAGPAKIFFASQREPTGTYLMDADGSNVVRIGSAVGTIDIWSPDGSKVALVKCPESWTDQNSELYVVKADGTGEINVSNHPARDIVICNSDAPSGGFDWSPDSTRLAFYSYREPPGLYVVNADGSGLTFLVDGVLPSWSPLGDLIAFIGSTGGPGWQMDLEVIKPDGSGRRLLARIPCDFYWLYAPSRTDTPSPFVLEQGALTTGRALASSPGFSAEACSATQVRWSPDGALLTFTAYPDPAPSDIPQEENPDVYVVRADGTGLTKLTDYPGRDLNPSWVDCSRPTPGCEARVANVAPETLNVRDQAKADAGIVGTLQEGAIVCFTGFSAFEDGFRWWPVRSDDGTEGWAAQANPQESGKPWLTPTGRVCGE